MLPVSLLIVLRENAKSIQQTLFCVIYHKNKSQKDKTLPTSGVKIENNSSEEATKKNVSGIYHLFWATNGQNWAQEQLF